LLAISISQNWHFAGHKKSNFIYNRSPLLVLEVAQARLYAPHKGIKS